MIDFSLILILKGIWILVILLTKVTPRQLPWKKSQKLNLINRTGLK